MADEPVEAPAKRKWWRYALAGAAALLLVGGAVGYAVVTSRIRSNLEDLVRNDLGGELQEADVSWRPPYGVVVRNAKVVAPDGNGGQVERFTAKRVDLQLDGLPKKGKPVVVEGIVLHEPVYSVPAGGGDSPGDAPARAHSSPATTPSSAPPSGAPPAKFSDRLQLRGLQVKDGTLRFEDPDGAPPATVRNVNLHLHPAGGDGTYAFSSTAGGGGNSHGLKASGRLQPDELRLDLESVVANVSLAFGQNAEVLPAPVRKTIQKYRLGGNVALRGAARVPLRSLAQSTYEATLEVTGGAGTLARSDTVIDKVNLAFALDSAPMPADATVADGAVADGTVSGGAVADGAARPATRPSTRPAADFPPLHVRLLPCAGRCGDSTVALDEGEFWLDPSRGSWKLVRLTGLMQGLQDLGSEGKNPNLERAVDRLQLRGQVAFTAAASGPITVPPGRKARDVVRYEVLAIPDGFAFRPRRWPLPIEGISGGSVRAEKGVIHLTALSARYGGDRLLLRSARIPLPEPISDLWALETRLEAIDGSVTCFQPGPPYPRGLADKVALLRPEGTFRLGGRYGINHHRDYRDDYSIDILADGQPAFSATGRRIPLTRLLGRATVSPMGTRIYRTEAHTFGGTLTAEARITPGRPTLYEGRAWVRGIDVALFSKAMAFGEGGAARKLSGRGSLDFLFEIESGRRRDGSSVDPLDTFRGEGEVQVVRGHFWEDPIVKRVTSEVSGRSRNAGRQGVGDAAAVFSIADRSVRLHSAAISSPSVGLQGSGRIGFDGNLDLLVYAAPLGDLRDKMRQTGIPLVGDVAAEVVGAVQNVLQGATGTLLYQYRVTGPAGDPQREVVPVPAITEGVAAIFGEMLRADEDANDRLLRAVKARGAREGGGPGSGERRPR